MLCEWFWMIFARQKVCRTAKPNADPTWGNTGIPPQNDKKENSSLPFGMFLGATSIFRSHLDSPVCSNARQEQKRKVLERDGFDVPVQETIHVLHGTSCCRIGGIEERNLTQLQSQSWSWTFFLIQHLLSFIDVYHWCLQRNPATAHLYHRIRSLVLECFCFGSFNYQVGHGTSKDFYIGTGTKVKSPSQKIRTSRAPRWRFTRMADERTWASFKGKQSSVESQAGLPLDSNGMQWAQVVHQRVRDQKSVPCHAIWCWNGTKDAWRVPSHGTNQREDAATAQCPKIWVAKVKHPHQLGRRGSLATLQEGGKVLSTQFLELNWEDFLFSKPLTKDQRSSLQVYHLRTYQSQNRQRAAGPPRKDRGRPSKCKASASRMATCADSQSRDAGSSQKKGLWLFWEVLNQPYQKSNQKVEGWKETPSTGWGCYQL